MGRINESDGLTLAEPGKGGVTPRDLIEVAITTAEKLHSVDAVIHTQETWVAKPWSISLVRRRSPAVRPKNWSPSWGRAPNTTYPST